MRPRTQRRDEATAAFVPSLEVPNRSLRALQSVPGLARAYRPIAALADLAELNDLPVLTADGYLSASEHLFEQGRRLAGEYLFLTSGSTGVPKISLMPRGLMIESVMDCWDPLAGCGSLALDFSASGLAASGHHFFRELCLLSGRRYLHLGGLSAGQELNGPALDWLQRAAGNAVIGSPTVLDVIGRQLESLDRICTNTAAVIWTGEPLRAAQRGRLCQVFPNAGFWGVYGSTETWVIGYQTPAMPSDEFGILPYQHIEVREADLLVTALHPETVNPILRFQMADRAEALSFDAFGMTSRIRLKGRTDQQINFVGHKISPDLLHRTLLAIPGVEAAQIVVSMKQEKATHLELRLHRGTGEPVLSEEALFDRIFSDDFQLRDLRGRIRLSWNSAFLTTGRNDKSPSLIVRNEIA